MRTPTCGKVLASLLFVEFYTLSRPDGSTTLVPYILEMLTVTAHRHKGHMNVLMTSLLDFVDALAVEGGYSEVLIQMIVRSFAKQQATARMVDNRYGFEPITKSNRLPSDDISPNPKTEAYLCTSPSEIRKRLQGCSN